MRTEFESSLDQSGLTTEWLFQSLKSIVEDKLTKAEVRYQILKDIARIKGVDFDTGAVNSKELPAQGEAPKEIIHME